jgi:hypothetical protein
MHSINSREGMEVQGILNTRRLKRVPWPLAALIPRHRLRLWSYVFNFLNLSTNTSK